jgi:hypothetical protein
MSRTIPITAFFNSNTEVRNDKRGVGFSVRVRRLDVHVDDGTDIEVKHVVKGNKMFIKVMADYTVVFEITANKDIDLVHDTYDGVNPWHKLIGLLVVHMYKFLSDSLRKELWVFIDGISKGLRYDDEFGGLLVWRYEIRLKQPNPERITQFRDLILQYLHERLGVSEVVVHG